MPQLGETVVEGTVTRWWHRAGDHVTADMPLVDVATDKADTSVSAAEAGTLIEIVVPEGSTVPVGAVLARFRPDAEHSAAPVQAAARRPPGAVLSPVVRRLLAEHRLAATAVTGSGEHGRITRGDVLAAVEGRRVGIQADDVVVPFSPARAATARAVADTVTTAALALVAVEVDYGALDPIRRSNGLTYLPFVARAVVDALRRHPRLNAAVGDSTLTLHRRINLGIAVAHGPDALVVPVIHDADGLRLRALAAAITDRAERARAHRLAPSELLGATFTITNVGRFGTVASFPIPQRPQVAICSTDGVRMTPVARETDDGWAVVIRPVGTLSLTFDHRALDGVDAAAFLADVRSILEDRDWTTEAP